MSLKLVLPLEERKYLRDLEDLVIIAPDGGNLPLAQVAELKYGQSFSAIRRIDGRRIVSVRALVDSEVSNTAEVVMSLKNSLLRLIHEPDLYRKCCEGITAPLTIADSAKQNLALY